VNRLSDSSKVQDVNEYHGAPLIHHVRETWVPLMVGFLFASAWNAIAPLISLQTVALGGDQATVGLVNAAHSIIPLVLAIPTGLLIRPRKVKSIMAGACGLAATAMLLSYTARSPTTLALGLVLFGGAQLGISLSTQVAILTSRDETRRQFIVGWYFTVLSIGQIVGPIVGSQLAADGTYPRAMMFAAVCMVAGSGAALLHSDTRQTSEMNTGGPLPDPRARSSPEGSLVTTLLAVLAAELVISGWTAFFPLFLEAGGSSIRQIGFYFSLRAVVAAGVRPFLGPLAQQFRPRAVVNAAAGVSALITAAMFQSRSSFLLAGLAIILGVSTGLIFPLAAVVISDALPLRLMGVGIGFRQVTVRLGQLVGPLALGFMTRRWEISATFLVYSGFAAFMVVLAGLARTAQQLTPRSLWRTLVGR
jgi:MFS family permease